MQFWWNETLLLLRKSIRRLNTCSILWRNVWSAKVCRLDTRICMVLLRKVAVFALYARFAVQRNLAPRLDNKIIYIIIFMSLNLKIRYI